MNSSSGVRFGSGLSLLPGTAEAAKQACEDALAKLDAVPDLVLVYFSADHDARQIGPVIRERTGNAHLLGCTGESIVGVACEVEGKPAVSVWMAHLPEVTLAPFHLDYSSEVDQGSFLGWTDELLEPWPAGSLLLLFGEPFTFPGDRFAAIVNEEQPGIPIVGGMASGADRPGAHQLLFGDAVLTEGAIGVRLDGRLRFRTLVSQGCRPIGQPLVITRADRNVIFELGGKPALVQLQEVFESLSSVDREKVQKGLHLGRVIDEYQQRFEQGDFLVRNVIGVDQNSGAIAVGDFVRAGQTVQFHIRDAQSADEDLRRVLESARGTALPAGGLLFTCNGRGHRLFGAPNHDADAFAQAFGDCPLAGFFAAGELGPVGGRTFLHGFTASMVLFDNP